MCNKSSAPHFIDSDMSDNDVPIGNDNAMWKKQKERIKLLTVQLSILEIYIKKTQREKTNSDNINHQSAKFQSSSSPSQKRPSGRFRLGEETKMTSILIHMKTFSLLFCK